MASSAVATKKRTTQNVKVMVRVRPRTAQEIEANMKSIVTVNLPAEITLKKDKKYKFDKVFPSTSSQLDVYLSVVGPMIEDVVSGYNCTVFAYGQTGTGKTHTMTGGEPSGNEEWQLDQSAGCIPRAAVNIFDTLNILDSKVEFTVRVSYLELYKEEVRDLLADGDGVLQVFNEGPGKKSVYIQHLKEVTVCNRNDIYELLAMGTKKRHTAATQMNLKSSRSHTVFSIIVHTRYPSVNGEDVLKAGKLNLVDLAGSENIAKTGAKEIARVAELANINRSLLTLGRVIQALVDKKPHIPYRDSKLTRILQDSLGGQTKTCIIATISPVMSSYEESVSTLEYATRARDITNCPQVNQKTSKSSMIKEMNEELEKLRKDLEAARASDGFYVNKDNYTQMVSEIETVKGQLDDKTDHIQKLCYRIKELEDYKENRIKDWDDLCISFKKQKEDYAVLKLKEEESKAAIAAERFISDTIECRQIEMKNVAETVIAANNKLTANEEIMHNKLSKLHSITTKYDDITKRTYSKISNHLNDISKDLHTAAKEQQETWQLAESNTENTAKGIGTILDSHSKHLVSGLGSEVLHAKATENVIPSYQAFCDKLKQSRLDVVAELQAEQQKKEKEKPDLKKLPIMCNKILAQMDDLSATINTETENNKQYCDVLNGAFEGILERLVAKRAQEEQSAKMYLERVAQTSDSISEIEIFKNRVITDLQNRANEQEKLYKKMIQQSYKTTNDLREAVVSLESSETYSTLPTLSSNIQEHLQSWQNQVFEYGNDLRGVTDKVDAELLEKSQKQVDHVASSTAVLCKNVKMLAEEGVISKEIELAKNSIERHVKRTQYYVDQSQYLIQLSCTGLLPVPHEGDTPVRLKHDYPRTFKDLPPRAVLLEKFKESYDKEKEKEEQNNKENNINTCNTVLYRTKEPEEAPGDA